MSAEIQKFLALSTAHVSYAAAKWLDVYLTGDQSSIIVYPKGEYGWFIYLLSEGAMADAPIPDSLKDCLTKAVEMGCIGVVLDADADTLDGLATYDW